MNTDKIVARIDRVIDASPGRVLLGLWVVAIVVVVLAAMLR